MGILNVTPDSFSDGGCFFRVKEAVQRGLQMVEQGAEIIDIGAESTRPGFEEIPPEEEWKRLQPVIRELKRQTKVPLSIDTRHVESARRSLEEGADIINDVGLGRSSEEMFELIASTGAGYILMHPEPIPEEESPHPRVQQFFEQNLEKCLKAGIVASQIVLDPGIGFGKTINHNLLLISGLHHYTKWNRPLLLGASRKSFMKILPGGAQSPRDRLGGSLAAACFAVQHGGSILRVHDVQETLQAVRLTELLNHEPDL